MATKSPGWKRPYSERFKATFGKHPLPPPQTPPSQLPTNETPVTLNLGDFSTVFHEGRWVAETQDSYALQQEILQLRNELKQVTQEKNLLEFKNELLVDMLTLSSLDVKYLEDIEKQLTKKVKSQGR